MDVFWGYTDEEEVIAHELAKDLSAGSDCGLVKSRVKTADHSPPVCGIPF
jgi:hypothetical protein